MLETNSTENLEKSLTNFRAFNSLYLHLALAILKQT